MTESGLARICPLCHYENPAHTVSCLQCGAPLLPVTTTLNVPEELPASTELEPIQWAGSSFGWLREGALALHVASQPQPIIVRGKREIVLGRFVVGEPPPTVDLTEYHAHLLGVSRKHAVIRFSHEGPVLEDLNSQNGTWLNEERLDPNKPYPLRHSDQIRLGQLILFVYLPKTSSPAQG